MKEWQFYVVSFVFLMDYRFAAFKHFGRNPIVGGIDSWGPPFPDSLHVPARAWRVAPICALASGPVFGTKLRQLRSRLSRRSRFGAEHGFWNRVGCIGGEGLRLTLNEARLLSKRA